MRKFKIIASVIGPYLPKESLKIDKYIIRHSSSKITNLIPLKLTANSDSEAMFMISHEKKFDTNYVIEWEIEAVSGKEAYEKGNIELDFLTALLSLPASSYKYYAEVAKIELLNGKDEGPDPESIPSPPVHILSYVPTELSVSYVAYFEKLLTSEVPEIRDLVEKFYQGIKSEILMQGDSNLKYYKILEEVSHKTLKKLKKLNNNSTPNYDEPLKKIEALFKTEISDIEKVKKIKSYTNELRALDYEQIGERILLTAKEFKLIPEILETLRNVNKYRAKVLAHPGKKDESVKLKDHRDIREMARLFLLHYFNRFYNLQPPFFQPVKENDSWYRYTYKRSDNGEVGKNRS